MFIVFGIMIFGIVAGYFLRRVPNINFIGKLITAFIFLLLFTLGLSVGGNSIIIDNLSAIGWQALIITLAAVIGSILAAWLVYEKFFRKEDENNKQDLIQKK